MSYLDEVSESLKRYFEHRIDPGSFLTAVLANDLESAVANADEQSVIFLRAITVMAIRLPRQCRGDRQTVENWLRRITEQTHG